MMLVKGKKERKERTKERKKKEMVGGNAYGIQRGS